jgi:hypothetical protein
MMTKAVRYWLLNNTYVDLNVPYEKIGIPFESGRDAALTDSEKVIIAAELAKCQAHIRAGNLDMLEFAVEICNRCAIPLPGWLLPHILKVINKLLQSSGRTRQGRLQREIHQMRWATVQYLCASQGLTWEDAFEEASRALSCTRARGSGETIRASYKWMNRHPIIVSLRQNGLPNEVEDFARAQYENMHVASERIRSLELVEMTKQKRQKSKKPRKR